MTALEAGLRELIAALVAEEVKRQLGEVAQHSSGDYLSVRAAAELADVAMGTVRRWIREGKLAPHRAGRVLRVRRDDLERLLRDGGRGDRDRELAPEELAARDFSYPRTRVRGEPKS